jgi:hypothetical protein
MPPEPQMEGLHRISGRQVRIASAVITLIGIVYTCLSLRLPLGDPLGSGEGTVPILVGMLWVIFGAVVTIQAPPLYSESEEAGTWPDATGVRRLLIVAALCLGFVFLMNFLGMALTGLIFMVLMARLCGASWKASMLAGVIMTIGLWALFEKFLQLTLPAGTVFSMLHVM